MFTLDDLQVFLFIVFRSCLCFLFVSVVYCWYADKSWSPINKNTMFWSKEQTYPGGKQRGFHLDEILWILSTPIQHHFNVDHFQSVFQKIILYDSDPDQQLLRWLILILQCLKNTTCWARHAITIYIPPLLFRMI